MATDAATKYHGAQIQLKWLQPQLMQLQSEAEAEAEAEAKEAAAP